MRYLLYGGDKRSLYLAKLLLCDGGDVRCFALEKAELPDGARHTQGVTDADCVILPVPAAENGLLKAPFSQSPHKLTDIVSAVGAGTLLCGGKLPEKLVSMAEGRGLTVFDIMTDPAFTVGNADITAEAAVSLLASELKRTVSGSGILIVGYGRIARLLSAKLKALGAEVCVMSRSAQSRAMARALGLSSLPPDTPSEVLGDFDAAVNTAPAPFVPSLEGFKPDCLLLELASYPYGFDADEAMVIGLNYRLCAGLPGKYAPKSAAELIFHSVKNKVKEFYNGKA